MEDTRTSTVEELRELLRRLREVFIPRLEERIVEAENEASVLEELFRKK